MIVCIAIALASNCINQFLIIFVRFCVYATWSKMIPWHYNVFIQIHITVLPLKLGKRSLIKSLYLSPKNFQQLESFLIEFPVPDFIRCTDAKACSRNPHWHTWKKTDGAEITKPSVTYQNKLQICQDIFKSEMEKCPGRRKKELTAIVNPQIGLYKTYSNSAENWPYFSSCQFADTYGVIFRTQ